MATTASRHPCRRPFVVFLGEERALALDLAIDGLRQPAPARLRDEPLRADPPAEPRPPDNAPCSSPPTALGCQEEGGALQDRVPHQPPGDAPCGPGPTRAPPALDASEHGQAAEVEEQVDRDLARAAAAVATSERSARGRGRRGRGRGRAADSDTGQPDAAQPSAPAPRPLAPPPGPAPEQAPAHGPSAHGEV
jgi:hypothetical protein